MVPQCPIHNWLSTASGALTHWHFWIALCAGPSMVHQAGKKKKEAPGTVTGVSSKQPSESEKAMAPHSSILAWKIMDGGAW